MHNDAAPLPAYFSRHQVRICEMACVLVLHRSRLIQGFIMLASLYRKAGPEPFDCNGQYVCLDQLGFLLSGS
jgi:hypothetical protein